MQAMRFGEFGPGLPAADKASDAPPPASAADTQPPSECPETASAIKDKETQQVRPDDHLYVLTQFFPASLSGYPSRIFLLIETLQRSS